MCQSPVFEQIYYTHPSPLYAPPYFTMESGRSFVGDEYWMGKNNETYVSLGYGHWIERNVSHAVMTTPGEHGDTGVSLAHKSCIQRPDENYLIDSNHVCQLQLEGPRRLILCSCNCLLHFILLQALDVTIAPQEFGIMTSEKLHEIRIAKWAYS